MKLFFLFFLSLPLFAHQTGLSFLDLKEFSPTNIAVTYKKPLSDTRTGDITINYPDNCFYQSPFHTKISNGYIIKTTTLECPKDGLQNKRIWIEGLVKTDRGILVYYTNDTNSFSKKKVLRSNSPFISLEKETTQLQLTLSYIYLGITHILMGYDHLMFVLLLLLLAKNLKQLFFTVTAFTLSHSITLTCSVLDLFYLPPPFVEMMIALSIIFLAKELLLQQETFTKRYLPLSSFSFGLLHGFGFSSALKDIGLPHNDIPLALFSFNVGIEIGQVIFILFVLGIEQLLKYFGYNLFVLKHKIAAAVGILAAFWFWQRFIPILPF